LADYYLRDRKAASAQVDGLLAANGGSGVPAEVLEWLGIEYYYEKNYSQPEKYLGAQTHVGNLTGIKPDFWFYLGDVASKLKNFDEAENAYSRYLQTSTD